MNNEKLWVDEMVDVLKDRLRRKGADSSKVKIIRSNHDTDVGIVVSNDTILFYVNGIGNLTDKQLEDLHLEITGTGNNRRVSARIFRPTNPEFTPTQNHTTSNKVILPNQNYLALRKSKY